MNESAIDNTRSSITMTVPGAVTRKGFAAQPKKVPRSPGRAVIHADAPSVVLIPTKEEVREDLESNGESYEELVLIDKSRWGKYACELDEERLVAKPLGMTATACHLSAQYGVDGASGTDSTEANVNVGPTDGVLTTETSAPAGAHHILDDNALKLAVRTAIEELAASLGVSARDAIRHVLMDSVYQSNGTLVYTTADQVHRTFCTGNSASGLRQNSAAKGRILLRATERLIPTASNHMGDSFLLLLCCHCLHTNRLHCHFPFPFREPRSAVRPQGSAREHRW